MYIKLGTAFVFVVSLTSASPRNGSALLPTNWLSAPCLLRLSPLPGQCATFSSRNPSLVRPSINPTTHTSSLLLCAVINFLIALCTTHGLVVGRSVRQAKYDTALAKTQPYEAKDSLFLFPG
ncbi:hypothetical protein B0I35DRAFT_35646 [Stachybotrys elegans]|uniref:Uncharacterized protein n=1 Tax=Stachybotrys elegans TaxID=80388 RepID=A0A8K0WWV6_9HYPO|nr:hypothetical protein B0I35DRAFT_35646 [Stachybotrys elegans]